MSLGLLSLFALVIHTGAARAQVAPQPMEPAPRMDPAPRTGASPVERPIAGDLGMSFIFGGLAPMSITGMINHPVNRLFFTEVGMKYMVADKWALPFSFGFGVLSFKQEGADAQNDIGVSLSIGLQRYFRIWRRIAPYFGAKLHIHYVDPTGDANYLVQFAIGPTLGIEYFIGDRVSLTMEYALLIGLNAEDRRTTIGLQSIVSMGGQMGLTFYF
jgi:hypothetical protein